MININQPNNAFSRDAMANDVAPPVRILFPTQARGAFGGLAVEQETPAAALSFGYNINGYFAVTGSANGGALAVTSSMAKVSSSTNVAGSATLESRAAVRYTPGQGVVARFTAIFSGTSSGGNSLREIGIGDANDGFFFAISGTNFGIIRRNSGSDEFISQSAWNGTDKFDGTGPTGVTINPAFGNVYQVRYQWLGFGPLRFFVENPLTGELTLAHTIQYPNSASVPSVANPNLPLRVASKNLGNNTDIAVLTPSMGAYIEGPVSTLFYPGSSGSSVSVAATELPIVTIQVTGTFQGKPNRVRVRISSVQAADSNAIGNASWIRLRLNPTTLTGAVFVASDANTSVVNVDTSATAVAGGREVFRGAVNGQGDSTLDSLVDLNLTLNPGDVLSVTAQHVTGGASAMACSINWQELFSG